MKFRTGLLVGFAVGFYVGSWAGRGRYEQINQTLGKVKQSDAFDAATDKAKAVVDLGKERAKDIVDARRGRETSPSDAMGQDAGDDTTPLVPAPGGDGRS